METRHEGLPDEIEALKLALVAARAEVAALSAPTTKR
jgi:hypothetical protein